MSKIISFFIFLSSQLISLTLQECQSYKNNCKQCHPLTNLCAICEKTLYKPDENGGCVPSQKCTVGENYCNKCNNNGDFCLQCELGLFADESGGCSTTDNCVVSENGKCLQCKDDFYPVPDYDLIFCKYKFSNDFKNCVYVNSFTGKCISCEKGFYLSSDDNKCTNTDSCKKSHLGICTLCNSGYFLDKTDNLCKTASAEFNYCKISLDGKICSECINGFFLSENNLCGKSQNCVKIDKNANCIECSEGYFLSENENICTTEEHCQFANNQFGNCVFCDFSFYIELDTGKCYSNQENEKFKFCTSVLSGKCTGCEYGYFFDKDNKCVSSLNCLKSENGICLKCEEGYHLELDNHCVNVEKCKYSNAWGKCIECENNYYFDPKENKCLLGINQYKNCKTSDLNNNKFCKECKDDFYLSTPDKMCYNNTEKGLLYKCAVSTKDGNECSKCINNYFVGVKDKKCVKTENCAISENENKCIECDDYLCLDVKKQTCETNYWAPDNDEQKIYVNCNKTNEEGTECEICNNYSELINGICVDKVECAEEKDGECIKCNEESYDGFDMCINNVYGCVETIVSNCSRCDNIYNLDECTKCIEGHELDDEKDDCVAKEEI